MSELPFLTNAEILEICAPLTQPFAIVRWFRKAGFSELKVRPNGMPLIGRSYFNQVIGGASTEKEPASEEPDKAGLMAKLAARKKALIRPIDSSEKSNLM